MSGEQRIYNIAGICDSATVSRFPIIVQGAFIAQDRIPVEDEHARGARRSEIFRQSSLRVQKNGKGEVEIGDVCSNFWPAIHWRWKTPQVLPTRLLSYLS